MPPDVDRLISEAWPAIRDVLIPPGSFDPITSDPGKIITWSCRISPGIPSPWPRRGEPQMFYYASAAGTAFSTLVDGEFVTGIWGYGRLSLATGVATFEILAPAPQQKGVQGVRPLRPEEAETCRDHALVEELAKAAVAGKVSPDLAKRAKDYYLRWSGFNRVSSQVEEFHPAFYAWLRAV